VAIHYDLASSYFESGREESKRYCCGYVRGTESETERLVQRTRPKNQRYLWIEFKITMARHTENESKNEARGWVFRQC